MPKRKTPIPSVLEVAARSATRNAIIPWTAPAPAAPSAQPVQHAKVDRRPAALLRGAANVVIAKNVETDNIPPGKIVYLEGADGSGDVSPVGHPDGVLEDALKLLARPQPTEEDVARGVTFQLGQIDYVTVAPEEGVYPMPRWVSELSSDPLPNRPALVPVIRAFGCTDNDLSVLTRVHGFEPYLLCRLPDDTVPERDVPDLKLVRRRLDDQARKQFLSDVDNDAAVAASKSWKTRNSAAQSWTPFVVRVEANWLRPLRGVWKKPCPFLKITTGLPKHVPVVRKVLERGRSIKDDTPPLECYEADVPFPLRFMVDREITGCDWLRVISASDVAKVTRDRGPSLDRERGGYCLRRKAAEQILTKLREDAKKRLLSMNPFKNERLGDFDSPEEKALDKFWDDYGDPFGEVLEKTAYGKCAPPWGSRRIPYWKMRESTPRCTLAESSRCSIEADVAPDGLVSLGTEGDFAKHAPQRVLSFDTEWIGKGKRFCEEGNDPIVSVCFTLMKTDESKPTISVALQLKECAPIPGCITLWFDDEKSLIMALRDLFIAYDPDIVTGYNINNFDWRRLIARANTLGIQIRFCDLSRIRSEVMRCKKGGANFSSRASTRSVDDIAITGVLVYDMHTAIKIGHKLSSYKLNAVAEHFLGETKMDVGYDQLPVLQRGSVDDRKLLSAYCVRDAELPQLLAAKLMEFASAVEMARATKIPIDYILKRGQSIRVTAQAYSLCRKEGLVVDSAKQKDVSEMAPKYEGAIVLEAKTGFYVQPIVTLDFASLYPSIIIAHNICLSTLLEPHQVASVHPANFETSPIDAAFLRAPKTFEPVALKRLGISSLESLGLQKGIHYAAAPDGRPYLITPGKIPLAVAEALHLEEGADYAKLSDGSGLVDLDCTKCFGVLPKILMSLLARRRAAKKQLEEASDPAKKNVMNLRQLQLKLGANAGYGATGAPHGRLTELRVAGSVTGYGREMISMTKGRVESKFGASVKYGDSVTGDTPILIRRPDGAISYVMIKDVEGCYAQYHGDKEAFAPSSPLYVWTDAGFTRIVRVIRHMNRKSIMRVLTRSGCVDVTEDHSLIRVEEEKGCKMTSVTPKDVVAGARLLHADLPVSPVVEGCPASDRAFAWGVFYAGGACGTYRRGDGYWGIINQNVALLQQTRDVLVSNETRVITFEICDTISSSIFNLSARGGDTGGLARRYKNMFYADDGRKKVPDEILNASEDIRRAFVRGYYAASGGDDTRECFCCKTHGKIGTAGLFYLFSSLGYAVGINERVYDADEYHLAVRGMFGSVPKKRALDRGRKDPDVVKKIHTVREAGLDPVFVYDLETENHHFAAGVGRLVVHNTDSVMADFMLRDPIGLELLPFVLDDAVKTTMTDMFLSSGAMAAPFLEKHGERLKRFADANFGAASFTRTSDPAAPDARGVREEYKQHLRRYADEVARSVTETIFTLREEKEAGRRQELSLTCRDGECKAAYEIRDERGACGGGDGGTGDIDNVMREDQIATIAREVYARVDAAVKQSLADRSAAIGKTAARAVSAELPYPCSLEFEKVYLCFALVSKKRYADIRAVEERGVMKMKTVISKTGLEGKRRDSCVLVKETMDEVLEMVMLRDDLRGAIRLARKAIFRVMSSECSLDLLIISSEYSKEEADYLGKQKHLEVVKKMRKRDPANAPRIGDRVPFVITAGPKKAKAFERAEDPIYVLKNKCPIDAGFYVNNQLRKPLIRIMRALVPDPELLFDPKASVDDIVAGRIAPKRRPQRRGDDGEDRCAKKRKKKADGDADDEYDGRMIVRAAPPSTDAGKLGRFLVVTGEPCLRCAAIVSATGAERTAPALCPNCLAVKAQRRIDKWKYYVSRKLASAEADRRAALDKCASCETRAAKGSAATRDVEDGGAEPGAGCENADCRYLYRKAAAADAVQKWTHAANRFGLIERKT